MVFNKTKNIQMSDFLNISSSKFLGGENVHNLIKIAFIGAIAYKVFTK